MGTTIKITFNDSRKVTLKSPDKLEEAKGKKVCIVLDNFDAYVGIYDSVDESDENIVLRSVNNPGCFGLPCERVVGWFYEKK